MDGISAPGRCQDFQRGSFPCLSRQPVLGLEQCGETMRKKLGAITSAHQNEATEFRGVLLLRDKSRPVEDASKLTDLRIHGRTPTTFGPHIRTAVPTDRQFRTLEC